jgi:cell division protein FtsL
MNRSVVILIITLMGCSLMLVYSQQRARMLFAEKNRLELQEQRLNQEISRLEYEQRELSKSSRIVDIASKQLRMKDPKQDKTIYIKEKDYENK